jgi:23S rRNA (uracil1939-C5)-methyltransferase
LRRNFPILEDVLVSDYAAEGKALARVQGKVIFIDGGAVPGDRIDIRLNKNKKDWAEGKAIHFHTYSPERVTPFCKHFGICGGCKWQMLPYEKQLQYKQLQVEEILKRIGKLQIPAINPIIGAEFTEYYRNKLEFTFSNRAFIPKEEMSDTAGGIPVRNALGFHIPKLFDKVLDIDQCYLQEEPSNKIKNLIRTYALEKQLSFYDLRTHNGWLRNLILRITTTGEIMLNVCFKYDDEQARKSLFDYLLKEVPEITTLLFTINPKQNDSIFDLRPQVYYGNGYVKEKLENFIFNIGPKSFFQTNTRQAEQLYQVVRNLASLSGKETLYDLYCGTGSIGIFLSGQAKKVIGIELIDEAVEDAKENAALNQIQNTFFLTGDVTHLWNDELIVQYGRPDVVITDPPRAGMQEKLVNKLIQMRPPVIIYVSCNPATQARDLWLLGDQYNIITVQPVDMFPHTHHIENVILLKLKN